jgi:hypothetical protein
VPVSAPLSPVKDILYRLWLELRLQWMRALERGQFLQGFLCSEAWGAGATTWLCPELQWLSGLEDVEVQKPWKQVNLGGIRPGPYSAR